MYRHDKPTNQPRKDPFHFVLLESPFISISTVSRGHTAKTKYISKQLFPEQEYRGLSPNFYIHVSVSDLYIPMTGLPILLEEICRPILGLYKSLTAT